MPNGEHIHESLAHVEYAMIAGNSDQGSCSEGGTRMVLLNTFKEAMSSPKADKWRAAANKEMDSLKQHKVYELIPATSVPSGAKTIGSS